MSKVNDMLIAAEEAHNNDERLANWRKKWEKYQREVEQYRYDPDKDPDYLIWLEEETNGEGK